jgi:hypothetical protein
MVQNIICKYYSLNCQHRNDLIKFMLNKVSTVNTETTDKKFILNKVSSVNTVNTEKTL